MEIVEVVTTTRTFTDLMTGETTEVTGDLIPVTITINGQTSDTLYFADDSLSALRALAAEDGGAFRALFAPVKTANGSGSRNTNIKHGAYPWERRAFAATKGLADPNKGGVLSADAEAAFAKAVEDGSYTVTGTAKPPASTDPANAVNAETPVPASGGRNRK